MKKMPTRLQKSAKILSKMPARNSNRRANASTRRLKNAHTKNISRKTSRNGSPKSCPKKIFGKLSGFMLLQQIALRGQIDRHELRNAALGHGHAVQTVHAGHRHTV